MSDMYEKKSEIAVLQRIPSHQGLMKVNRWLMAMVFFLMTVIVIAGFFFFPANDITRYKKSEVNIAEMNPVLSAEVNTLKGQFVGLVSGSIESKLRTLEESVRLGTVSTALGTIEDLKNDVKVLRSYSEPAKQEKVVIDNKQLMQEMSELKRLIYVTLASCGLMLAAVVGIWFKNRYRLPYKEAIIRYLGKK
ncbi:MAG: hypothetical protein LUO94_06185 [Methylococcaceae bacterium]|jgi:hypothetical protein|nr:hypothetical protein [Methylococcaceae bacterium]MDD1642329.1 hypothetical protein [Methylococcaceae bacterium]OYV18133.1 MAG: hypothetical protein CG441_1237 [Methylococcaceae bacterium NSM2-1]